MSHSIFPTSVLFCRDTTDYPHNIFPNVPKDCNAYPNEPLKVLSFPVSTNQLILHTMIGCCTAAPITYPMPWSPQQ